MQPLDAERLASFGDWSAERTLDARTKRRFRTLVYGVFEQHRRSFPWRETSDPYRVLVSELMLQQTQTERVVAKYRQFIERFPDAGALARGSLREVLQLWQGLGYNRRAKALHDAVRSVVERFGGELPADPGLLRQLPGVGPYTAAAVCVFAFGLPLPLIETNIRRVFLHYFFDKSDGVHDREILPIVEATLDRADPRSWFYALMDLGVALKRSIPNPNTRSVHYARQSAFENSNRQVRGRILRLLTNSASLPFDEIASALPFDAERVTRCLGELVREGMLAHEDSVYRIRESGAREG